MYPSDSLETMLSHLSTRVMAVIAGGNNLHHLDFLLEFLAAWEKHPMLLTPMAYQWCSTISEAAGGPEWDLELQLQLQSQIRFRTQDLAHSDFLSQRIEREFSHVGPSCDMIRNSSHHTHGQPQDLTPLHCARLFSIILEIGFRLTWPGCNWPALHLNHTTHHKQVFEMAFSSHDDEVIADALSAWIVDGDHTSPGPFVHYFSKRTKMETPFSPRLRSVSIHVIEHAWDRELEETGLEIVHLLNHLKIDENDMVDKGVWMRLLVRVISLPTGLECLPSHYWLLLGRLNLTTSISWTPGSGNLEVMRSLEKVEDWEKLEVWVMLVWQSLPLPTPTPTMEDVKQVTLRLLMQQPMALPRFKTLCERLASSHWTELQQICNQAQAEQLPLESLPLYVPICPVQYQVVLKLPFFHFSQLIQTKQPIPLPSVGDDTF
jgi:hypothetical protein